MFFEALIISCVLVLFRSAAFVAFLPPVAGRNIPNTVKIGLAMALTLVFAPRFAGAAALQMQLSQHSNGVWLQLAWLAIRETVLGASLAWLFGLCLVPARIAGSFIASEMGLTMAELTAATDDRQSNVVAQIFEVLGVLLFFGLNLHHTMFLILGSSFALRPVTERWPIVSWDMVMYSITKVQHQGFLIAAPVGILMFAATVTLLVSMRTAPQFNFMTYGMTLRLILGLAGIIVFFPDLYLSLQTFLNHVSEEAVAHG
ncbi:MAG: flagellar biosynthetic protein FliR [Planctomycetaceae bacterium]|nr:flagellar biosynthetic protein FliR [Planctomycetaceae bacterium]